MNASPESWNYQSAYASLKANAKQYAGLENARALIRQSRQIRYLRYVQLAHLKTTDSEEVVSDSGAETAEGEILVQGA